MDKEIKTKDKIAAMLEKVKHVRAGLLDGSNFRKGIQLTFDLIVDYIEFMLTPCDEDDD